MKAYSSVKVFLQFLNSISCCLLAHYMGYHSCHRCDDKNKSQPVPYLSEVGSSLTPHLYNLYDTVSGDQHDKKKTTKQNKLKKTTLCSIQL